MPNKPDTDKDFRAVLHRLREDYQRSLDEISAEENTGTLRDFLPVRLGAEWFGVPRTGVSEVLRVPPLVRVPGAARHIAGIINLRGEILTVLDLRVLLGLAEAASAAGARLVVVKSADLTSALLVDEVQALRSVSEQMIEPVADGTGAAREFLSGRAPQSEGLLALLDLDKILQAQ